MQVRKVETEWKIYRTRFLIRAKQLTKPLTFVDPLGREHRGRKGDYLVESSDGTCRIAPREIFEDVYVPMGLTAENWSALPSHPLPVSPLKRRATVRATILAASERKAAVENGPFNRASQPLRA
jgi:hypothetical protein